MKVFWDEQRIDRLEKKMDRLERKMDDGFAGTRSEVGAARSDARSDFRLLLGVLLAMYLTMILGFAGILLQLN
jgi:tetrahydromethanopterin S-methyltransferase subunit G